MVVSFYSFFFFFFKQKTAYEMRISDWSSDVCSSDLAAELGAAGRAVVVLFPADLVAVDIQHYGPAGKQRRHLAVDRRHGRCDVADRHALHGYRRRDRKGVV